MLEYRCYFLDAADHISAVETIEAASLDEAMALGAALLRDRQQCRAIEIWDGTKRLYPPLPDGGS